MVDQQSSSLRPSAPSGVSASRPRSIRHAPRGSMATASTSDTSAVAFSSSPSKLSIRSYASSAHRLGSSPGSRPQLGPSAGSSSRPAPPVVDAAASSVSGSNGGSHAETNSSRDRAHALSPESLPHRHSEAESRLRRMASNATLRSIAGAVSRPASIYESRATSSRTRLDSTASNAATDHSRAEMKRKQPEGGSERAPDADEEAFKARRKTWFGPSAVSEEVSSAGGDANTEDSTVRRLKQPGTSRLARLSQIWSGPPAEETPEGAVPEESRSDGEEKGLEAAVQSGQSEAVQVPPIVPTEAGTWRFGFWRPKIQAVVALDAARKQAQLTAQENNESQEPEAMDISNDFKAAAEAQMAEAQMIDAQGENQTTMQTEGQNQTVGRTGVVSYITSWIPYLGPNDASSSAGAGTSAGAPQDTTESKNLETELPEMSPAERVKHEALQQMNGTSSPSKEFGKVLGDIAGAAQSAGGALATGEQGKAVVNPATRGSWMSFWGSRSANPARPGQAPQPAVTESAEVMEIDEPAAPTAAASTPHAQNDAAATRKEAKQPEPQALINDKLKQADRSNDGGTSSQASGTLNVSNAGQTASALNKIASLTKLRNAKSAAPSSPVPSETASLAPPSVASMKLDPPPANAPKPEPEPPASRPTTPLTGNTKVKDQVRRAGPKNGGPNLVVPTFEDTFNRPPRSLAPRVGLLDRTVSAVNSFLFSKVPDIERMKRPTAPAKKMTPEEDAASRLPKSWTAMGQRDKAEKRGVANVGKVVIIGVHGWFTQGLLKTFTGPPTGTSERLAGLCEQAVRKHMKEEADMELNPEAITVIPLTGDGKVSVRVDKFFAALIANKAWTDALREADALFVVAHSQGAPVSTHLLARLLEQKHVDPLRTRVGLLALCGIHNGPFVHLQGNITGSYLHYFETAAAKELFEFLSSSTPASRQYAAALQICLDAGVKMVYIASVDDQVVPLYSALHSSITHPSILRALYVDGQAFPRTDFLVNLLTFCVAVRNAGTTDHSLLTLLSSSVAGSLYGGMGHSLIYDEPACYELAVRYLFETTSPLSEPTVRKDERSPPPVQLEPFEAQRWNPYQLPWALRGLLEDKFVRDLFSDHITKLLEDYDQWRPLTKTLRDVQFRLQPMTSIKRPQAENQSGEGSSKSSTITTTSRL